MIYVRYSSKATWYPHVCWSLKFPLWLHHAFNFWKGTHYIRAYITQIVRPVYPRTFHLFLNKPLMKLNINCIHTMNLWMLSLYVPINPWVNCPTEKLLTYGCMQYRNPYCLVWYRLVWRLDPLLAIEFPLTSSGLVCPFIVTG